MKYDTFFLSFSALFSRTLQSSLLWSVKNSSDLQMTRKPEFRFLEMHPFLNPWLYLKLNYPQGQFFFVIVFLVKCKWQYIYIFFQTIWTRSTRKLLVHCLCAKTTSVKWYKMFWFVCRLNCWQLFVRHLISLIVC